MRFVLSVQAGPSVPLAESLRPFAGPAASHPLFTLGDVYSCFTLDNLLLISKSLYLLPEGTRQAASKVYKLELVLATIDGK